MLAWRTDPRGGNGRTVTPRDVRDC